MSDNRRLLRRGMSSDSTSSSSDEEQEQWHTPPENPRTSSPPSSGMRSRVPGRATPIPDRVTPGGTFRYGPAAHRLFGQPSPGEVGAVGGARPRPRRSLFGTPSPVKEGGYSPLVESRDPSPSGAGEPSTSQQTEPSVRPKTRVSRMSPEPQPPSRSPLWIPWQPEAKDSESRRPIMGSAVRVGRHKASSPSEMDRISSSSDSESGDTASGGIVNPLYAGEQRTPPRQPRAILGRSPYGPGGPGMPSPAPSSVISSGDFSPRSRSSSLLSRTSPPRAGAARPRPIRGRGEIPEIPKTPTPELVQLFRHQRTPEGKSSDSEGGKGWPNLDLMRKIAPKRKEKLSTKESREIGRELATQSRSNIANIKDWRDKRSKRKQELIESRFPVRVNAPRRKKTERPRYTDLPGAYDSSSSSSAASSATDFSDSEARHLIPRSDRRVRQLMNPAYAESGLVGEPPRRPKWNAGELARLTQRLRRLSDPELETYRRYTEARAPRYQREEYPGIEERLGEGRTDRYFYEKSKQRASEALQTSWKERELPRFRKMEARRRRASLPSMLPSNLVEKREILGSPGQKMKTPKEKDENWRRIKKEVQKKAQNLKDCTIQ